MLLIIDLRVIDLVSSPVWWEAVTNIVIYEAFRFDVAQDQMNGARSETRTHSCRFASLAC